MMHKIDNYRYPNSSREKNDKQYMGQHLKIRFILIIKTNDVMVNTCIKLQYQ